ncbi:MAG: hypothetical protein H6570_09110 [Lewinellaceae bacterium]|nr:hypothetical protein [Lewinellaceae bacterium]
MQETRKLSTILFADIVGYTALMQNDEPRALQLLQAFKALLQGTVPTFEGVIVQYFGDACLLSFDSTSQGVRCGMQLQTTFKEAQIPVRIGIHLGEVVFTENNVFGDGVNIASRIESMGVPGGVLISKNVRDQIKNKSEFELRSLGPFDFKNVSEPLEVFAIANEGFDVPRKETIRGKFAQAKPKSGLLKNPIAISFSVVLILVLVFFWLKSGTLFSHSERENTIAVLPFSHQSQDSSDIFFTEGVHEDVMIKLAGIPNFRIISKSSVMEYKDFEGDLKEVGKRLNASYILQGSVRRWEDQVRITAQLVDVQSNEAVWSHEYDGELINVFDLQSSIATEIAQKLQASLTKDQRKDLEKPPTTVLSAYDDYLKARFILNKPRKTYDELEEVVELLDNAVKMDPKFTKAWSMLVWAHSERYDVLRRSEDKQEETEKAAAAAEDALAKAKELSPDDWSVLSEEGGYYYYVKNDRIAALNAFEKAIEKNPSDVISMSLLSRVYISLNEVDKSIDMMERTFALTQDQGLMSYGLTMAYEMKGEYGKMVPLLERLYEIYPEEKHYLVESKYYQFLQDGKMSSFIKFKESVETANAMNPWDERAIQNKEMVVAMFNDEFDAYHQNWKGRYATHTQQHGNWVCPMVANDNLNEARLLLDQGENEEAYKILTDVKDIVLRPINRNSICVFNPDSYLPKLDYLMGDTTDAKKLLEQAVVEVLENNTFPTAAVERSVILQDADLILPDEVYYYYEIVAKNTSLSYSRFESICANPWTYPNLIKDPQFIADVKADGRFVEFLTNFGFLKR